MTRCERRRKAARRRRIRAVAFGCVVALAILMCAGFNKCARADGDVESLPEHGAMAVNYITDTGQSPAEMIVLSEVNARRENAAAAGAEKPYTDEDVIALAKMAYGEALITGSDTEISACMWCACNRLDSGNRFYEGCESVYDIVTQGCQFYGCDENNPVDEHLLWLAQDVLDRWTAERNGAADVGRTLPKEYCFFFGDGLHNHFTTEHMGGIEYDWSPSSPYES